jgi:hypothetical protein
MKLESQKRCVEGLVIDQVERPTPNQDMSYNLLSTSVASLKFIEEQQQILRLTTPELKNVRGPVRSE